MFLSRASVLAAACSLFFASAAVAESTAEAMRVFGLVGTWSFDCANPNSQRTTYAVPIFGNPTVTTTIPEVEFHNPDRKGTIKSKMEVISAIRATEDKLKIRSTKIRDTIDGVSQDLECPTCGKEFEVIIVHVGSKKRTVQSRLRTNDGEWRTLVSDGWIYRQEGSSRPFVMRQTDKSMELSEKCLN